MEFDPEERPQVYVMPEGKSGVDDLQRIPIPDWLHEAIEKGREEDGR